MTNEQREMMAQTFEDDTSDEKLEWKCLVNKSIAEAIRDGSIDYDLITKDIILTDKGKAEVIKN